MLPTFTQHELATEEWRPVVGFEGLYEVSSLGRVRRIIVRRKGIRLAEGFLARGYSRGGYLNVTLSQVNGSAYRRSVHSLVAAAFAGPRLSGHQINHCDGDKTNNRYCNLEYVTPCENMAHAKLNDLMPRGNRNGYYTSPASFRKDDGAFIWAKLSATDVIDIRKGLLDGVAPSRLARSHNVHKMTVSQIKYDRTWQHLGELRKEIQQAFLPLPLSVRQS